MNKKIILIIFTILTINIAHAQQATLAFNKNILRPQELLIATLHLEGFPNENIIIETYIQKATGETLWVNLPLNIAAQDVSQGKDIEVLTINIPEIFEEGDYIVKIRLIPENIIESAPFSIIKELKSLSLTVHTCKDKSCKTETRVFEKLDNIYFKFESGSIPKVNAILIYPNGNSIPLSIPTSIKAAAEGSYKLIIEAEQEGYGPYNEEIDFAVIEKPAIVEEKTICNANSRCEINENHQNCPTDCQQSQKDGYCDQIIDSVCDPDCSENTDPDCVITENVRQRKNSEVKEETVEDKQPVQKKVVKESNKKINLPVILMAGATICILAFIIITKWKRK